VLKIVKKSFKTLVSKSHQFGSWSFIHPIVSPSPSFSLSLFLVFNLEQKNFLFLTGHVNNVKLWSIHRHLRNIDCLTARTACLVMNVSFVSCRSRKKKKRRLFCAALVAGTVNKLEQSILRLRYLWVNS
jgi:hypothetical protein